MISEKILAEAASELNEAIIKCLPDESSCCEFSHKFERKMKRIIREGNHPIAYRTMRHAASLILVLFLSFMALLALSPSVRAAVFGWVREQYESFTAYYLPSNESQESKFPDYELSYLLENYEKTQKNKTPNKATIYYSNPQSNQSMFFIYAKSYGEIVHYVKTEGYTLDEVSLNGVPADVYLSENAEQANAILWSDPSSNTYFLISAFTDKTELIKLAEGVKILE